MKVRKALYPLHIVSKLLCTSPFSLKTLQPSLFGSLVSICQAIGYVVFHLSMVNRDLSAESPKNIIRQLIDMYNRYSGFCAFCFLVITSTLNQGKIVAVIRNMEVIDEIFEKKLDTPVENNLWRRYCKTFIIEYKIPHTENCNKRCIIYFQKCFVANQFLFGGIIVFRMAQLFNVYTRFDTNFRFLYNYVPGLVFVLRID